MTSVAINGMTNEDIREELSKRGFNPGPITPTTRVVYEKKLEILLNSPSTGSLTNGSSKSINKSKVAVMQEVPSDPTNIQNGDSAGDVIIVKTPEESNNYDSGKEKQIRKSPSPDVNGERASDDESGEDRDDSVETLRFLTDEEKAIFNSSLSIAFSRSSATTNKKRGANNRTTVLLISAIVVCFVAVLVFVNQKERFDVYPLFQNFKQLFENMYKSFMKKVGSISGKDISQVE